jgi:hypothetical protein
VDIEKILREILKNFWLSLKSLPVILGAFGLAFLLLALTVIGALFYTPGQPDEGTPTAILTIVPGPTSTLFVPTATATRVSSVIPDMPPSPIPGMIGVSAYVQIFGTDGAGLNIREGASLAAEVRFVAYEAEVFEVREGPVVADGFTWWFLVTPVDAARSGWAAANYLSVVPRP